MKPHICTLQSFLFLNKKFIFSHTLRKECKVTVLSTKPQSGLIITKHMLFDARMMLLFTRQICTHLLMSYVRCVYYLFPSLIFCILLNWNELLLCACFIYQFVVYLYILCLQCEKIEFFWEIHAFWTEDYYLTLKIVQTSVDSLFYRKGNVCKIS